MARQPRSSNSTVGAWLYQVQKTETSRPPLLNVTRIHVGCRHTCICQPVSGVAVTSWAEALPMSKATRPPATLYPFTFPDEVDGLEEGEEFAGGSGEWLVGFPSGDVAGFAEGDGDGLCRGRCVEDGSGNTAPCAVWPSPVSGTARGGSYAVPAITVWTPHQESVTAAPVASDHAQT